MDGDCKGCTDLGICVVEPIVPREDCPCKQCLIKMVCVDACKPYQDLLDQYYKSLKESDED